MTFLGGVDPISPDDTPIDELVGGLAQIGAGQSYLAWAHFQSITVLYDRVATSQISTEHATRSKTIIDAHNACITRLTKLQGLTRTRAEQLVDDALALRDRLPEIALCLRDGVIAPWQAHLAVSRTHLVEGHAATPTIDTEIAAILRRSCGSWTRKRLRDMIDRVVFRHDPDAVRERRKEALDRRGVWTHSGDDGVAELSVVMAAENIRICAERIKILARSVCGDDGRTFHQRASDAMFALITGTTFDCQCGSDTCAAPNPPAETSFPVMPSTSIVLHVVCDESTLAGTAAHAGFVAGHGLVSDEHVRDIAARPDTTIVPLVPAGTPSNPDGTYTLPAHQPADPYRPSAALDTFIRIRDGYCVEPGCECSAFDADVDHVTEYDHIHSDQGGQTTEINLNSKCRPDHIAKTFGDLIDDQWRDSTGRLRKEYSTPDGLVIAGEAETLEELFPGLRRIRFDAPSRPPPNGLPPCEREPANQPTPRLAAKHARRRAERARNRARRAAEPPPPF